jgi:phosphate:Na+ symporter
MQGIDVWELLAGLGIFLFGIFLMEESIKNLSGRAFKKLLRKYTEGKLRSIFTGAFATAILQSSSAVTLMLLAFAGAGIITFENALGAVLGTNVGTTLTAWIVAGIGFKVNIEALAMPFIGIGGLGLIFLGKTGKANNISKLLVGFGFLFLGLDYMKKSLDNFAANFDLSQFEGYHIIFFLIIGFILTALVQSSSASMAIILSAINAGLIDFSVGAAMVIGTNLGTTVTVLIGAIGGTVTKKRVAWSHFFFNFITGIIAFLMLPILIWLLNDFFNFQNDPVIGLALFHTIFNVIGVLAFLPFLAFFAAMITRWIPEKRATVSLFIHTSDGEIEVVDAGISFLQKEVIHLLRLVIIHNQKVLKSKIDKNLLKFNNPTSKEYLEIPSSQQQIYALIKDLQEEILTFSSGLQKEELSPDEGRVLINCLHAVKFGVSSAKSVKDFAHDFEEARNSDDEDINKIMEEFSAKVDLSYRAFTDILLEEKSEKALSDLIKQLDFIYDEEDKFIIRLSSSIKTVTIQEDFISILLTINRGFLISGRQLSLGLRELKLDEKEGKIFESLLTI